MKVDLSTKIDLDEIDDEMFMCQVSVGLLALILIILMAYCYKYYILQCLINSTV